MIHLVHVSCSADSEGTPPYDLRVWAATLRAAGLDVREVGWNAAFTAELPSSIGAGEEVVLFPDNGAPILTIAALRRAGLAGRVRSLVVAGKEARRRPEFWSRHGFEVLPRAAWSAACAFLSARGRSLPVPSFPDLDIAPPLPRGHARPAVLAVSEAPDQCGGAAAKLSPAALLRQLDALMAARPRATLAFMEPSFSEAPWLEALLGWLEGQYEGIWSGVLGPDDVRRLAGQLPVLVEAGLYRVNLVAPHPGAAARGRAARYVALEQAIATLTEAGVLSVCLQVLLGAPGESGADIDCASDFACRMIRAYPGRVEARGRLYDPIGIDFEDDFHSTSSFVFDASLSSPAEAMELIGGGGRNGADHDEIISRWGAFKGAVLESCMSVLHEVPVEIARRQLLLDHFEGASAWNDLLMNVPHIRCYARALVDYHNILLTAADTPAAEILDCYPMRTADNFLYTEDERVIVKLYTNSMSVLGASASAVFTLASGELTGWQIAARVARMFALEGEAARHVEADTAAFLRQLDRAFAMALVRPLALGTKPQDTIVNGAGTTNALNPTYVTGPCTAA